MGSKESCNNWVRQYPFHYEIYGSYTFAVSAIFLAKPVHADTTMVQSVVKFIDANSDCMGAITLLREKSIFFNYSTNLIMTFIPQT